MSPAASPALTVVVPSVNGWPDLDRCLAALERERATLELEVIVPERCGAAVREAVSSQYPWAELLPVPASTSIPEMRARAFTEARAPTVAVIEDHVLVTEGWAGKILAARAAGARVVGGTLVNTATERVVYWAAFLCEYSHLVQPLTAGPVEWLTGNNTAYDRALLEEFRGVVDQGGWEDVLHQAIRRSGVALWCRPDLVAHHEKHYTVGEYTAQRFLYARGYAALRLRRAGPGRRLWYGLLAWGLPPVLFFRIVSRTWRGGAHRRELLRALPLLPVFVTAWGLGEVAGAWLGEGGALARVT